MVSGQIIDFGTEGTIPVEVFLEPVVGPDGQMIDLEIAASIGPADQKITMTNRLHTRIAKPTRILLEKPGSLLVTIRMQTNREFSYWGPPALATEGTKAEALKKISAALK